MINTIKNMLKERREGVSTFEWVLVLPFTIVLSALIIFSTILLLSWVSYGAVASNLAKDLNFRQTGLKAASTWVERKGSTDVLLSGQNSYGGTSNKKEIYWNQIYLNGNNAGVGNNYIKAIGYHMNEYKNQFFFPYTQINKVDVKIKKLSSDGTSWETNSEALNTSKAMSGNIIQVDIHYQFNPIQIWPNGTGMAWNESGLVASGYGIVT